MAFLPEIAVEIAFDSGVLTPAADRTWTDVSDYVELDQLIVINRGRSDEFATTSPATCSLTVDNRDGRFTPGRASSPYYPDVKIGRPIRVVVDPAGDASVRFTGFVDEWPVEWSGGTDATAMVPITASSRLARLGEGAELRSVVETEILADSPTVYYPLTEGEGAEFGQELTGQGVDTLSAFFLNRNDITFGTGEGVATDNAPAPQIASHPEASRANELAAYYTGHQTQDFTIETFVRVVPGPDADFTIFDDLRILELFRGDGWLVNDFKRLRITGFVDDGQGYLSASFWEQHNGDINFTTNPNPSPGGYISLWEGDLYHVAATYTHDATNPELSFYVNGQFVGTSDVLVFGDGTYETPLESEWVIWAGATELATGTAKTEISHVAIFDSILPADRIEAHALAGLNGFATETAGDRIERILGYADVGPAEIDAEPGVAPIGHIDPTDKTVESLLRIVEETEGGILFDGRDGSLRFLDRDHRYAAAAAFTLDAAQQQLEADSFRPVLDRTAITNEVTAKNLAGTLEQRYSDDASATDYGRRRRDVEIATTDVDQLYQAAAWRVNRYKDPRPRFASLAPVDVLPLAEATRDAIRDADISTRFAVDNLPSQAPDDVDAFFVEGIVETLGPESWRFQFNASPAAVYDGLFVLGTSTLDGPDVLAY